MEEPGYLGAQSAFVAAGAKLVPLRVTPDGWNYSELPEEPPKLIYLTPSCHSPTGITMLMEQRLKFLELADRWGSWVIEDDFDSEYRFTGQPIPAMQGTDVTDRTIYIGTFAKTLMPALRLGFVVLPSAFVDSFQSAINLTGQYPPLVLQATLADFIDKGYFGQHLRRTRRLYARRREEFIAMCSAMNGKWLSHELTDTGLQMLWQFRRTVDDRKIARAGADAKLNLAPFSQHFRHGGGQSGLVLGYAALNEREMRSSLMRLRTILAKPSGNINGKSTNWCDRRWHDCPGGAHSQSAASATSVCSGRCCRSVGDLPHVRQ
jgi:GntR family transcriptional regulator/MocR family aminotransferase